MSALDHATEIKILQSIKENFPYVTIISVTHNPNTISEYTRFITIGN